MKKILLIAVGFLLYAHGFAQDMKGIDMKKKGDNKGVTNVTYTCVMHPQIHASKPGNCPICGMKLVKENTSSNKKESPKAQFRDSSKMQHKISDSDPQKDEKMGSMEMNNPQASGNPAKTVKDVEPPRTIRYDLYVKDTMVNYTGKMKMAIAINGSIPAPTLTFTEGDTAEIYVHNLMKMETSIHWHGVILPNRYDGVSYLTTQPIRGGQTHLFKFPIVQNGTYWYHSHTMFQEQSGMYGALIFKKRVEPEMKELAIVLSDWTDMRSNEVNRSLHNQTDWFSIRKNTVQSYAEAIKTGHLKTKLANEWKRMTAMDVSDVAYDRFFVNGFNQLSKPEYKAGDRIKIRVVNGGSSSYFWLNYAGGKITVVANDGVDVEPVDVDRLIIAPAETYDLIVGIPKTMSYELLVTPEDRTSYASLWLGTGTQMSAIKMPRLKYFAGMKMMNQMMDMHGNMKAMGGMKMSNQQMDMNTAMYPEITGPENAADTMQGQKMDRTNGGIKTDAKNMQMNNDSQSMAGMDMAADNSGMVTLNYGMLRSMVKTSLPDWPSRTFNFELTGNMNRYVWTINNKTVSEAGKILIKKGEIIRVVLYNNTMMRHPMHLHGHSFRVLNGKGDYSPLKNTIDIMPMERDTIEFAATESGDWFFHCHILYHMMSGMGRIFSYENSEPNPEVPDPKRAIRKVYMDDRMPHFMSRIGIESNGSEGFAMLSNTRYKLSTLWHIGYTDMHGFESETMVGRYLGRMQWWYPYIGFDYHYKVAGGPKNIFGSETYNWLGQVSNKNNRKTVAAGIAYTLPLLFIADGRIDGDGKLRFQLSREDIPVTRRLRFNLMINTDKEYMAGLRYIVTKYVSLSSHYDSDMGLGAGVTITY